MDTARLAEWKHRYGTPPSTELERLLKAAGRAAAREPAALIDLHETLLFLRAYPPSVRAARLADAALAAMARRVAALRSAGVDLAPFEEPKISGIAGTGVTAVFSYEVARRLAARHGSIEIDWEAFDEPDRLGPVLRRIVPPIAEDWPVEAHTPFRQWMQGGLRWLLERLAQLDLDDRARADLYESLQLALDWKVGDGPHTRSRLRLRGPIYCHTEPLLRRRDIKLDEALEGPPLDIVRLTAREAERILDTILDTSAIRYRELYGFSHPDTRRVFRARDGRGLEIYFFGVPPEWRLPLRAYHAGMFFKNGVPAGYVEVLSLFDRAEVGFNVYYTFREGESAWIYARLLRLFRQVLGVNTFSVDPYQIGRQNEEAIDSGAFWFYRKLGFHPVAPEAARLLQTEERHMARQPEWRSSRRTLRKLADGYLVYDGPGAVPGEWDQFRVRHIGLAMARAKAESLAAAFDLIPGLPRWTPAEKAALNAIVEAKQGPDESRYLRLMQQHPRLRAAWLRMGSHEP